MKFINTCNCIYDKDILESAIRWECKRRNINPNSEYKIFNYRGYAGISIKHDKLSIHRLIGEYMLGMKLDKSIHIHHIDGNKMNNVVSNLQAIRSGLHTKEHNLVQYVSKDKLKENAKKATKKIKRSDVTSDKVIELINKGLTIPQIANELNCGYNTICRRLGMKDY